MRIWHPLPQRSDRFRVDALSNMMRDAAAPAIQQGREMSRTLQNRALRDFWQCGDNTFMGKVADLGTAASGSHGRYYGGRSEDHRRRRIHAVTKKLATIALTDAVKTAQSPIGIFQKHLGTTEEDQAQADLSPTLDDQLAALHRRKLAANMERDEMRSPCRAQVLAENSMSDPPPRREVRDRITGMALETQRLKIGRLSTTLACRDMPVREMGEAVTKVDNFIQRMKVQVEKSRENS